MIVRKPYAFLIKHFRKIHIALLILCGFIYYKNIQLNSFVKEFIDLGTYDIFTEPINNFVSPLAVLAMLVLILGSTALVLLLRHKKKPWKLYILPILSYVFLLILFISTKNFFDGYTGQLNTAGIRAIRDLLLIATLLQYPSMLVFLIRILGIDLNKFNFKVDEEYLELSSEDREELEINIDFDKNSIKRGAKRLLRNIGYLYQEYKLISNIIIVVIIINLLYSSYTFIFVTNKTYKQGQSLETNGYTIRINDSYYSDKDYTGNKISNKSAFVVLNLTIKNNAQKREIDLNKFHIMNGIRNYTTTAKTYETEFQDYGKAYSKKTLKRDETVNLIMIFKVDKKLSKRRFVLYYQELNNNDPHLRKIKLKLNDVSKINKNKPIKLNEELNFTLEDEEETIIFDDYKFYDYTDYSYRTCGSSNCTTYTDYYTAKTGKKILKISFASNNFEGKDMIDFSSKYGKIIYINNKGKEESVEIKNPFSRSYYGKYLYVEVPEALESSESLEIRYTIRNNQYIYKLR